VTSHKKRFKQLRASIKTEEPNSCVLDSSLQLKVSQRQ